MNFFMGVIVGMGFLYVLLEDQEKSLSLSFQQFRVYFMEGVELFYSAIILLSVHGWICGSAAAINAWQKELAVFLFVLGPFIWSSLRDKTICFLISLMTICFGVFYIERSFDIVTIILRAANVSFGINLLRFLMSGFRGRLLLYPAPKILQGAPMLFLLGALLALMFAGIFGVPGNGSQHF